MNHQVSESYFEMKTVLLDASNCDNYDFCKHLSMQVIPMNKHVQFRVRKISLYDRNVEEESYHNTLQSAIEAYNEL